jgi:hypothetical protein
MIFSVVLILLVNLNNSLFIVTLVLLEDLYNIYCGPNIAMIFSVAMILLADLLYSVWP